MGAHGLTTNVVSDVVLPVALAVVTLGMGLSLSGDDFRRIARMPRAVLGALFAQVVLLPVLAAGVAVACWHLLGWSEALVLGLLLLAACPGGATSNLVTYLARADTALSVSVTSVSSLASAVTTPLAFLLASRALFGTGSTVSVSFLETAAFVAVVIAAPIALGMLVRRVRPGVATRAERPVKVASILFLALVIAGVVYANRADFWDLAARSVPGVLALNVLALAVGLGVGYALRLRAPQARAISIEVGFQNGTLGIALAVRQLGSAEAAIVPGFYGLVMFLTGGALAWWWARSAARAAPYPAAPTTRA